MLTDRIEKLDTLLADVTSIEQRQLAPLERHLIRRTQVCEAMAEATLTVGGMALSHAAANGLVTLVPALRVLRTDLLHGRFDRRVQTARRLAETIRAEPVQLDGAGITPELMMQLEAKIAAAEAAILEPRSAVAARRAATEALEGKLREAEALVRDAIDPLVYPLRAAHPELYARYRAAREVVHRPATRPISGPATATASAAAPVSIAAKGSTSNEAQPLAA